VNLPAVLSQADGPEPDGQATEGAAGVDLRQLGGVADQHDLGAAAVGVVQDLGEEAGADHARLVDDQHRVAAQPWRLGILQVQQQPADGAALDAGAVGQFFGRLGG
jgi:hypothetical protein